MRAPRPLPPSRSLRVSAGPAPPPPMQTAAPAAPSSSGTRITLARPDDWHLHVRDGPGLAAVVPASAAVFGRVVVMPNLVPPVVTVEDVSV